MKKSGILISNLIQMSHSPPYIPFKMSFELVTENLIADKHCNFELFI